MRGFLFVALVCLPTCLKASAADAPVFIDFRVETPLQKRLIGQRYDAEIVVDGDALIVEGKIDPARLDRDAFLSQFRKLKEAALKLTVRVTSDNFSNKESVDFLGDALKGMAVQAGISPREVGVARSFEFQSFQEKIDASNAARAGLAPGPEKALEYETCTVYPVQTAYTSWISRGADCYVFVKEPLTAADDEVIPAAVREAVRKSVAKLKPPRRERIIFSVTSQGEGRRAVSRFEEREGHEQVAKELGFESGTLRHVPR